jgi:thiopeptide-type bacteriocin biosynthesis protein
MQKIGERFRNERLALESLLDRSQDAAGELAPGFAALARRSERMIPLAARLHELERAGRLQQSVAALAASYLHMHANRLLPSSARAQELVLYDFLERLYKGQLARSRKPPVAASASL